MADDEINKDIIFPDKNKDDKNSKEILLNKLIDLEHKKLEKEIEIGKTALQNKDKSDERHFEIAQQRNQLDKDISERDDKHRSRIFYVGCFFAFLILAMVFYLTLKESELGISILTHFFACLASGIASYFYGKNKKN